MQESKLIELLKVLDVKELRDLQKFVQAPMHNTNKAAAQLFEYLHSFAPSFISKKITRENAFQYIYPSKSYSDVNMRRIMSDLLSVCEEFVVWNRLQQQKDKMQLELLNFYREKKLDKHFSTTLKKLKKHQTHLLSESALYQRFCVEKEVSEYIVRKQDRTTEPNLQTVSDHLDAMYLLHKLKISCSIVHYQILTKAEYELPMLSEILTHLQNNDYQHIPIIPIYHHALQALLEEENEVHFENFRNSLFKDLEVLDKKEQQHLFIIARNYCIRRSNKGDETYLIKLLELYKIELEKGIVLENGYLSSFTYKNIVTLGIRIGDFDWTASFIENYTDYLEATFRESAYTFNMARLCFAKQEFEEVISLLFQTEYRELFVELNAKTMLLKTYYELQEYEPLASLADSFRIYLIRKKRLNYHQTSYLNFIKCIRQLIRLSVASPKKVQLFKDKIINIKELTDKDWFIEKVNLLL